ncbi:MAG: C40 family peptidase [Oscillospiraceae bacterium]|jgi:cell wall-associated NlpC family hydrolase|nr:C40 family peptidase [Oscillospiraceae bacterium]
MKRLFRAILILALCIAAVAALAMTTDATELKTGIGIVDANGLRLRAKPNTDAKILATASNGDNVVIIRKSGDWYLVNYNLYIGYMHGEYLEVKERENINLGDGSIDPAIANMRSGPSTSSSLVEQVSKNEKVYIFGFNTGWYKVKYDGKVGYIRSDLVTLLEKPEGNRGSTASGSSGGSSSTSLGQQISTYAQRYVGYPYVYGGTSPSGFDCSGFVQYVYKQFGYSINRTATAQLSNGYSISYSNLAPGDLVFFGSGSSASHVGLYIGGGKFVHASNPSSGVKISALSESYYANSYIGARRIVG